MPIEEHWLIDSVGRAIGALSERGVAVDVGANVGNWTKELVQTFDRVLAIEPDERASSQIPEATNLEVILGVAAESDGELVLHKRPSPEQNSLLETHPIGAGSCAPAPVVESVTVPSYSLDSLCPDGADFVKVDVEGAEGSVLRGCSDDGRWDRTAFVVECHNTFDEVSEELQRLNKDVTHIAHPSPAAHRGHCWAVGLPPD